MGPDGWKDVVAALERRITEEVHSPSEDARADEAEREQ